MKRSQSATCIDLSLDEDAPAPQRRRTLGTEILRPGQDLGDGMLASGLADPEVEVIEPEERSVPRLVAAAAPSRLCDDEDLAVLGTTGQV